MVDWQLVVEVLKAFAWPIALIVVLMIFRRPTVEILGKLQKFKLSGFEIEMKDKVAALDEKVAKVDQRLSDVELRERRIDEMIKFFDPQMLDWRATGQVDKIREHEHELDRKDQGLPIEENRTKS
jgi:hypothetical protein